MVGQQQCLGWCAGAASASAAGGLVARFGSTFYCSLARSESRHGGWDAASAAVGIGSGLVGHVRCAGLGQHLVSAGLDGGVLVDGADVARDAGARRSGWWVPGWARISASCVGTVPAGHGGLRDAGTGARAIN
jgi:hypothetical protein